MLSVLNPSGPRVDVGSECGCGIIWYASGVNLITHMARLTCAVSADSCNAFDIRNQHDHKVMKYDIMSCPVDGRRAAANVKRVPVGPNNSE